MRNAESEYVFVHELGTGPLSGALILTPFGTAILGMSKWQRLSKGRARVRVFITKALVSGNI